MTTGMADLEARNLERTVEFNVLGPVTVTDGTETLNIGGPKQRTVLSMLIAHHGRPVSNDAIAEAVYGDETTPRNRRNVQTYVSTLRSQIGDVIKKQGKGWYLDCDRAAIDALAFEDRYNSAAETPVAAARILREALTLWRGHPYSDIEGHHRLDAEITRLSEMRVAAQAARIEADLEAGRHADLIGEIEGLLAEHPYSERFRAQHMLALYRAGRQREALRSYETMRGRLVDELGVDPTPDLQDLEQKILEQDTSLDANPVRQIQKKAVLVADPGDPIELARLNRVDRELLLAVAAEGLRRVVGDSSDAVLIPAGTAGYAVFDNIGEAIRSAEHLSLRLSDPGLRVAVDFGEIEVSDGGVSGAPVSRAAVLVSVAHRGQVLLSAAAQQELTSVDGSTGLRFESLGRHELVGIEDPASVYQLLVGDPPRSFPPLETDHVPAPLPEGRDRSVPGYELREAVGEGSIGTLYRAYQPAVGREVLVEVIGRSESSASDFVRRFEADAQRLALLDHPNINPLLDYWRDTEGAYLVYRWHRGGFVDVPSPEVVTQVASALAYAHSYGLVHGSVRPDRVMLDESGNGFLMGFPIAGVDPLSSTKHSAYIPPELLAGEPPSVATDIYALGILAYESESGSVEGDAPVLPESPIIRMAVAEDSAQRQTSVAEFISAWAPATRDLESRFTATRNPYKGLAAFHESDADDFFGRASATAELVEVLRGSRFMAVVGPSGIGKSSVVRAGLIPALRRGAVDGSDRWVITDMLPGSHPFLELERALERVAIDLPSSVRERFADRDTQALAGVERVLPANSQLLLLVDQFEELFTMSPRQVAADFLDLLVNASGTGRVRIVVTMRADFLDRPLFYSDFGKLLGEHLITVRSPMPEELVQAIVSPAGREGVAVDPELVGRMVAEVHDTPGALPLLQHTLSELFEVRTTDVIDVNSYDAVGGVSGSLAARAESVYGRFDESDQGAVKQAFLRLVTVLDDAAPTRRRVRVDQLKDLAVAEQFEALTKNRLLVADNDPSTRTPTVEIAHEALLDHWPRFAGWIETAREDLTLRRRLDGAIQEWEAGDKDRAYLLTAGRLAQHQSWTSETTLALNEREHEFLHLSEAHDQALRASRRRKRVAIVAGFAIAAVAATGFGIFGLQKAGEAEENASVAIEREEEAEAAAVEAQARSLLSAATAAMDEDPALALLLASEGVAAGLDDPQSVSVLRNAIRAADTTYYDEISIHAMGSLNLGEISPDGRHLLVGVDANIIELRDIASGGVVWTYDAGLPEGGHIWTRSTFVDGGSEVAVTVAFEPEEVDPSVELPDNLGIQILDRETGDLMRSINRWRCGPALAAFNPNLGQSRIVVVVPTDEWHADYRCAIDPESFRVLGQQHVVDVSTGESFPVGPVHNVVAAPFPHFDYDESMRRRVLWDPEGPTLTVVDTGTGEELMRVEEANRSEAVAISPDGSLAVSGGAQENNETQLLVYEVATGEVVAVLAGHGGSTNTLRFVDRGARLLSSGDDGLVKVWDPVTGELLDTILTGEGNKWAFSLTDDESRLAVYGNTVTVVSLDSASTAEIGVLDSCGDAPVFYAGAGLVARGQKVLAYAGCEVEPGLFEPDPYKVFDLQTQSLVFEGLGGSTQGVDLSSDGQFIAGQRSTPGTDSTPSLVGPIEVTNTKDGSVVVMDGLCEWVEGSDGEGPDCVTPPGEPYAAYAHDIRFSSDGLMVSMAGGSGVPGRIWDSRSGEKLAGWPFHSGQFTPDASRFVSIDFDEGLLQVRDTGEFSVAVERELQDEDPWIEHFQITPDGLVVGVDLNGLAIYDIDDLSVVGTMPGLHESFIRHIALSADGTMVATAGRDGFAKVWDIMSGTLLHEIHASEDDRVQAVAFSNGDEHLLVAVAGGPLAIYSLNIDELLGIASDRHVRGFNDAECALYFPDLPCPTLEEIRAR